MPAFITILSGVEVAGLVGLLLLASRIVAMVRFAKWGAAKVGVFFNGRGR